MQNAEMQTRRRHQRDLRESEILEAAFEEFAARGYAAARLEDVARRAGVAKGLPSFYFDSKASCSKPSCAGWCCPTGRRSKRNSSNPVERPRRSSCAH